MAADALGGQILARSIWSVWDIGKPQVSNKIMAKYGLQNKGTFDFIRTLSRDIPVGADTFYGWEDNKFHRHIKVRTTIGDPGTGNDAVIVLAATDLDTSNRFYPRVGDVVTIPTTEVQARVYSIDVTSPTAPAITLKPLRAADNIGILTTDMEIPITSGMFAAGTDQPTGTIVGYTKKTFYTQLFKETVGAEGDMLAKEDWGTVYEGGNALGVFTTGTVRAEFLMALKIDGALSLGVETTNTGMVVPSGEDGAGNSFFTTRGFVPHVRAGGTTDTYTPGSFDIEDLFDVGTYLRSQYVNNGVVCFLSGSDFAFDVNTAAFEYFADANGADVTSIAEGAFGGIANMQAGINFRVINLGDGFKYVIPTMENWSNPETFGLLDFTKKGIVLPVTSFKNPMPGEARGSVDNFNIRYREANGYNRKFEAWSLGGAGGGTYVSSVDKRDWYYRAELGLEMYKTNQTYLFED